ncbi:MAG: macro domain-containing protein [Actinomycetota bacterium]|nr:macro domain-containing protein [Actinomycetota bacterium]
MIEFRSGDIFHDAFEALVNTVNCEGVMGRGIALQFKKKFPDNFKAYAAACSRGEVCPGRMFVYTTEQIIFPKYIVNFPTKRQWRNKSKMVDIEVGLRALVDFIVQSGIHSIAIPPLGSGLGGLEWSDVKKQIESALVQLTDVHIVVFEPNGAPQSEAMARIERVPKMTLGRAALIELISSYLKGHLDPFISLLEIHKIMYFLQESGEQLRLQFVKGTYGPYAENLRHTLNAIEGHMINGYADGGDTPAKLIELKEGAISEAQDFLANSNDTYLRVNRVTELLDGFESPMGVELLATVHWVVKYESTSTLGDTIVGVHGWNERKRQFSEYQIAVAREHLERSGWI